MKVLVRIAVLASFVACGGGSSGLVPDYRVLSPEGARHVWPAYSPDGSKIAYWAPADSGGMVQLWIANADLSNPVKTPVVTGFVGVAPIWSPDGSQVAATSSQFGTADVVIVPASGGAARRVTSLPGVELPLMWYPDGDRIAFGASTTGGTFTSLVVSLRTGASSALIPGEKRVHFAYPSPDGSHILVVITEGSKTTLWLADSAGANLRQLTTEGFEATSFGGGIPRPWSPDGKQIVYESKRTGTTDLWVVSVDSGKPRQLTRDIRNDYFGSWSGDGKWIAFLSDRGRQIDAWAIPAAGGVERRITDSATEEDGQPAWRANTNELAIVAGSERAALFSLDLASGTEQRITADSIRPVEMAVSPDGKQVAYLIERGGGVRDLAVAPVAGGASRVVFTGGMIGFPGQPSSSALTWSPDGKKIACFSDRGGSYDIWMADAAGGAPLQLTNWPGFEFVPVWSSDGASVFFVADRETKLSDIWRVPATGGEPTRVSSIGSVAMGSGLLFRTGANDFVTGTLSPKGGQFAIARIRANGTPNTVWDKTTSFLYGVSPSGDSVSASVEQADGKHRSMILATNGGGGRVILKAGEGVEQWSPDGNWLLYSFSTGGASEIGLFNRLDGTQRRLTTTPEDENNARFTADGKTVLFRRAQTVKRLTVSDLTKLLAAPK